MKRQFLLFTLVFLLHSVTVNAQRAKGLVFDKEAYEKIELADDDNFGFVGELPSSISLKKYAPKVGNQGTMGTCVGWSTAYGALTIEYAKKMNLVDNSKITFSAFCPYYIYNQFKESGDYLCQTGGLFEDALAILYDKGAKRFYTPEYSCTSSPDNYSTESAAAFKINNYYRLYDWDQSEFSKALGLTSTRVENIKNALADEHPVLFGAYVPPSFDYCIGKDVWEPTQYERDNYNTHPGHAMVIVGYDDNMYGGAFQLMNSWGSDWGKDGFIWVKYDDADIFGHTAFYMDLGYKYYPSKGCQFGDCNNSYSKYKWDNGDVYEGEWKNGALNGMGIYFWNSGLKYSGEWKDGMRHGKGVELSSWGTKKTGYWKDNSYVGIYEPTWTTTEIKTTETETKEDDDKDIDWSFLVFDDEKEETNTNKGCVSGNCTDGFGKFIYDDGDIYEGNFKSSYRHGYGKYQYIEGDVYDGMWNWNDRKGLGYYIWPSKNEYIGFWSGNQMNGLGTKYYVNGTIEAGQWVNSSFQKDNTFGFSSDSEDEAVKDNNDDNYSLGYSTESESSNDAVAQAVPNKSNGFSQFNAMNSKKSLSQDPNFQMANTVLKSLLKGIGKTDLQSPKLNIINSSKDVAFTNKNTGIHVSSKFIDLCRSFGPDSLSALSVVMSHELAHYFKDHFFCRDFGYAYADTEWGDNMPAKFRNIKETGYFETQADEFGLFYSFVSGYEPFEVADKVISKIYEEFTLPDEMPGYPPKDFRVEQIGIAKENVQKLIPVFEIGNLMTVLSSAKNNNLTNDLIDNATLCYEHIINQKITTPEMYNNLGVNYVNKAINLIESDDFPYVLPVEIDFNSRIYSTVGSGTKGDGFGYSENEAEILEYLNQAKKYFENAIKLDEKYIPAYNNLSATYLLLFENDEAWVKAKKALKLSKQLKSKVQYRNSLDLLAIVNFLNEEQEDAVNHWNEALAMGSNYAITNIAASNLEGSFPQVNWDVEKQTHTQNGGSGLGNMNPKTTSAAYNYKRPNLSEIEKIDGKTLYDISVPFVRNGEHIDTWKLGDEEAMIGKAQHNGGEFFIYAELERNSLGDQYFFYFYPNDGKRTTSLNVANGNSIDEVIKAYGPPVNVISSNKHNYWVYINKNIIFKINEQNKVDGYIIYDVNL